MNWTNDDIEKVEKFIELKTKGFYCDGAQLTEVYNRVLDKRVNPTNCGSCIRQRINELENALNAHKRSLEASKEVEVDNVPQDENNAVRKAKNKK